MKRKASGMPNVFFFSPCLSVCGAKPDPTWKGLDRSKFLSLPWRNCQEDKVGEWGGGGRRRRPKIRMAGEQKKLSSSPSQQNTRWSFLFLLILFLLPPKGPLN